MDGTLCDARPRRRQRLSGAPPVPRAGVNRRPGAARGRLWRRDAPRLAVETDPEVAGWTELVVAVETTLPVDEADRRLEGFDTTWWLANLPRAQGKLFFTLDFV